jgi:hypothetical protein
MYTFSQRLALAWGKVRRTFLIKFRKGRVLEKLERRRGACSRCGACCKLLFDCPAYDDSDGSPKCLVYNDRPGVCGLFPLDEKDLRERDFVMPDRACGFRFEDGPAAAAAPGPRPEAMPVRWGPPKRTGEEPPDPSGKPRWLRGVWAVLWVKFGGRKRIEAAAKGNGNVPVR